MVTIECVECEKYKDCPYDCCGDYCKKEVDDTIDKLVETFNDKVSVGELYAIITDIDVIASKTNRIADYVIEVLKEVAEDIKHG